MNAQIQKWREEFEAALLEVIGTRRDPESDPRLPEWAYEMLGRGVTLMEAGAGRCTISSIQRTFSVDYATAKRMLDAAAGASR